MLRVIKAFVTMFRWFRMISWVDAIAINNAIDDIIEMIEG
jgi:hypothetical protein